MFIFIRGFFPLLNPGHTHILNCRLIDSTIEIAIATYFLYTILGKVGAVCLMQLTVPLFSLGVSCFLGLGVAISQQLFIIVTG